MIRRNLKKMTALLCVLTMVSGPVTAVSAESVPAAQDTESAVLLMNNETPAEKQNETELQTKEEDKTSADPAGQNQSQTGESQDQNQSQAEGSQDQNQPQAGGSQDQNQSQSGETAGQSQTQTGESSGQDIRQPEGSGTEAEKGTLTFKLSQTSFTYTGKEIRPSVSGVSVLVNGESRLLTKADYSIAYDNNVNVGSEGKVIVYGKGNYNGLFATADFEITKADIGTDCTVSLSKTVLAYTGKALKPAPVVTCSGTTLKQDKDYTAAYYNNTKVGTATAVVKGTGNFEGQVTMSFTIAKAAQKLTLSKKSVTVKANKTAKITVKGNKGKVTFKSSKPSVATVTGKGVIKGIKKGSATIKVTAAATGSYKKTTASIKVEVQGEALTKENTKIQLSTSTYTYDGKKKIPTVKKVTYKGKTLTKNKDYRVSYADNVNAGKAKVIIRGIGKYSGTVKFAYKIKKAANSLSAEITKTAIDVKRSAYIEVIKADGDLTFTSSNTSIATVAKNGVVTGKKTGRCTITVTAAGDEHHKKASKQFQISVGVRDLSDSNAIISLSDSYYVYDGNAKKPAVTVKYDNEKLTLNKDYTISYSNYVNAGTARVYVKGKGKYQGSRTVTYTISKADQKNFTISLKDNHIPYGGRAKVTVSGNIGDLSYGSYSPSYAKPLGDAWFAGLKKTQNYVTITVTAAGDENHRAKTIEMRVHIY